MPNRRKSRSAPQVLGKAGFPAQFGMNRRRAKPSSLQIDMHGIAQPQIPSIMMAVRISP